MIFQLSFHANTKKFCFFFTFLLSSSSEKWKSKRNYKLITVFSLSLSLSPHTKNNVMWIGHQFRIAIAWLWTVFLFIFLCLCLILKPKFRVHSHRNKWATKKTCLSEGKEKEKCYIQHPLFRIETREEKENALLVA